MKLVIYFSLVVSFAVAQPDVEIRLVNQNIGYAVGNPEDYIGSGSQSSDTGLNEILTSYGVTSYNSKTGHPYQPYQHRIISIPGTFPSQFITDLLAYSSVIESARISSVGFFSDALNLQIIDINIGLPTGLNGNIITTNDVPLNEIFQNFNVFFYAQIYPSASSTNLLRYYGLVCNCDINALKNALDAYTTVIESTENTTPIYLFNTPFEKVKAIVSPNPFLDNFIIQTEELITNFSVFDCTGKLIVKTSSKNELDNQTSKLQRGVYILNLNFENGLNANYKLVKK